jgi:hypothetical protein
MNANGCGKELLTTDYTDYTDLLGVGNISGQSGEDLGLEDSLPRRNYETGVSRMGERDRV